MDEFLSFRKFLTPTLIQIIFWLSTAFFVIAGVFVLVSADAGADRLGGLFMVLFGPLIARIYSEILLLGFRIYDTVVEIRDQGRRQ